MVPTSSRRWRSRRRARATRPARPPRSCARCRATPPTSSRCGCAARAAGPARADRRGARGRPRWFLPRARDRRRRAAPAAARGRAERVRLRAANDYDPHGDDGSTPDAGRNAFDGNPVTDWSTENTRAASGREEGRRAVRDAALRGAPPSGSTSPRRSPGFDGRGLRGRARCPTTSRAGRGGRAGAEVGESTTQSSSTPAGAATATT